MRAAALALVALLASSGMFGAAARAPETILAETLADPPCVPVEAILAASRMLGPALVIPGERAALLVDTLWDKALESLKGTSL